jgi:hypothetical protein
MRLFARSKIGSVLYRENCGGVLRKLASGFRARWQNIEDGELYQELRERVFTEDGGPAEQKQKLSA